MINRETRKWFWIGFVITSILAFAALAVLQLPGGRAQDSEQPEPVSNREALEASANPDTLMGADALAAIESASAEYSSPLVIPSADFVSDGVVPDGFRFFATNATGGGGYIEGRSSPDACLIAPAYLPNAATVTNMTSTIFDANTNERIIVTLYRANKNSGAASVMASTSTTNSFTSTSLQDIGTTSITNPVVDNTTYIYYTTTCLPVSTIRLYSVRLFYNP
jgi:hypothetical protein